MRQRFPDIVSLGISPSSIVGMIDKPIGSATEKWRWIADLSLTLPAISSLRQSYLAANSFRLPLASHQCCLVPTQAADMMNFDFRARLQSRLSRLTTNSRYSLLLGSSSNEDKARILSESQSQAAAWIHTYNRMSNRDFRIALCRWLDVPSFLPPPPHVKCCNAAISTHHLTICKLGGGGIHTHDLITASLAKMLAMSGNQVCREVLSFLPDRTSQHMDLITTIRSVRTYCDVTIIAPLAYLPEALLRGKAAQIACARKIATYGSALDALGLPFLPLPFENFGRMHPNVIDLISTAASDFGQVNAHNHPTFRSKQFARFVFPHSSLSASFEKYWIAFISCQLQSQIATNIAHRCYSLGLSLSSLSPTI
jgi:hypothetical protein